MARLYTVDEVNRLVPRPERIMARLQRRAQEVRAGCDALRREQPGAVGAPEVNRLEPCPEATPPYLLGLGEPESVRCTLS